MRILVLKYGRCYFDRDFMHIAIRKFIHLYDEYWIFYSLRGFLFFPVDVLISGIPRFQSIKTT